MGTRSRIGVMHGEVCKSVYCHWDGYLEYNGSILMEHYDSSKANNLVALGDISSLRPNIGEKHAFSKHETDLSTEQYEELYGNMTTFYGRDREENGVDFKVDHSFESFFDRVEGGCGEWYYVMRDGSWYVGNTYENDVKFYKKLVLLSEALAAVKETA
jgi:hypothetical protein